MKKPRRTSFANRRQRLHMPSTRASRTSALRPVASVCRPNPDKPGSFGDGRSKAGASTKWRSRSSRDFTSDQHPHEPLVRRNSSRGRQISSFTSCDSGQANYGFVAPSTCGGVLSLPAYDQKNVSGCACAGWNRDACTGVTLPTQRTRSATFRPAPPLRVRSIVGDAFLFHVLLVSLRRRAPRFAAATAA